MIYIYNYIYICLLNVGIPNLLKHGVVQMWSIVAHRCCFIVVFDVFVTR